jgi:hypothetical protein
MAEVPVNTTRNTLDPDAVDQAGQDSFPASDPTPHSPPADPGPPPTDSQDVHPLPQQELKEVHEHETSDPACR